MPNKKERWFDPQVKTGWKKGQPLPERRERVLRAHGGNELASARSMQALANVTTDRATKREARADARYFYKRNREIPGRRISTRRPMRITPKRPALRR